MNKEQTTQLQGICLMVMFMLGSSLVVGGINEAAQDSWIAIAIGALIAVPIIFIYARLKKILPGMDLYEVLQWTLGKVLGKICIALFVWYAFHLGALVIRNFTEFVDAMALPVTPQFVTAIILGIATIWAARSSWATLGRWSVVFLIEVLFVIGVTILLGISQYDINNLKPIAENGFPKLLSGGTTAFSFPFAETVIFLLAINKLKENDSPYKMWYLALFAGCGVLVLTSMRNLLTLGPTTYLNRYYSSYVAEMAITLGDFLSRFEIIVGANFLLCGFVKITICLIAAAKGIARLFAIQDYKKLAAPVSLLMVIFSIIVYSSMTEMFDWINVYKYYALPFQVIIPIIIWIIAEAKVKIYAHFKKPIPSGT